MYGQKRKKQHLPLKIAHSRRGFAAKFQAARGIGPSAQTKKPPVFTRDFLQGKCLFYRHISEKITISSEKTLSPGIIHVVRISVLYVIEVCDSTQIIEVNVVCTTCFHRIAVNAESHDAETRLVSMVNA